MTALMMTALYGQLECLNHLIATGAIVMNAQDDKVIEPVVVLWPCRVATPLCGPFSGMPAVRDTGLCLACPLWLTCVCAPAPSW